MKNFQALLRSAWERMICAECKVERDFPLSPKQLGHAYFVGTIWFFGASFLPLGLFLGAMLLSLKVPTGIALHLWVPLLKAGMLTQTPRRELDGTNWLSPLKALSRRRQSH